MTDIHGIYSSARSTAEELIESDSFRLFVVLLLFFVVFAHWVGYNETSRLDLTRSIVEDGDLKIDEYAYNTNDKSKVNEHFYSDKAPLPAFAAVPSYLLVDTFVDGAEKPGYRLLTFSGFLRTPDFKTSLARFLAVVTVSGVSGALAGVLYFKIFEIIGVLGREKNLLLAGLGGLGTHFFPYSTTFHGTMLGTMFLLLSTYLWLSAEKVEGKRAFLIAGSLALGVSASYLVTIPGAVLLLVIFRENIMEHIRNRFQGFKTDDVLVYGLAGGIAGLIPLLVYNTAIFGHPFDLTMFYNTIDKAALEAAKNSVGNPSVFDPSPGLMVSRAGRLLLSPGYGLLVFSPVLAFSFYGLRSVYSERNELFLYISGSFATSLLFISMLSAWGNGAMYGARYLLPASSLLFLAVPWAVRNLSKTGKMLFGGASAVSVFFAFLSTQTWSDYQITFSRQQELMLSFQPVYEYLYRDYVPGFHEQAFNSPMMSYLTGFTQNLEMVIGPNPDRTLVLGSAFDGLVVVSDVFLWVSLCFAVAVFVFRDEIKEVFSERAPRLSYIALGLLILSGFSTSQVFFDGSYPEIEKEDVRWGRQSPEINIHSEAERPEDYLVRFKLKSPENREVLVKLNGEEVASENVSSGTEFAEIISLEPGRNRISFETGECTVLGRINNNSDIRCVTVGMSDFRVNQLHDDRVVEGTNIRKENDKYVLNGNATLFLGDEKNYSIEMDGKAVGAQTKVTIYAGERKISSTDFSSFGTEFATPYFRLESPKKITIQTRCDGKCERLDLSSFGVKNLEEQPEATVYRFGSNWYRNLESEPYHWSPGNPSIYIYNYGNRTKEKALWLEGRSYSEPRRVKFTLNGENLGSRLVGERPEMASLEKGEVRRVENRQFFNIELEPGENILEMETSKKCSPTGNPEDIRCMSYGLKNLYLTEPHPDNLSDFSSLYGPEKSPLTPDDRLMMFTDSGERLALDAVLRATGGKGKVEIEGKEHLIDKFPTRVSTPYLEPQNGTVEIGIGCVEEGCQIAVEEARLRSFSEHPEQSLYRYGYGWYRKLEKEKVRYSTGDAYIYLYNSGEQPTRKSIRINLFSFNRPRETTFYLNDRKLGTEQVKSELEEHRFDLTLQPGENVFKLSSGTGCTDMGEVNQNQDIRCSTFGLRNLDLIEESS